MIYLGIDPGASGAFAQITDEGFVKVWSMPSCEREVWEWASLWASQRVYAVIEKIGGYVGTDEGIPGMGHSMFNFGMGYGGLRMALIAAGITFDAVTPQTWQWEFGMKRRTSKGETGTAFKTRLRDLADELFPDIGRQMTKEICDALLLAEYGRRTRSL